MYRVRSASILGGVLLGLRLFAQNTPVADLLAARQELEEEARIIKSDIVALQQRQDVLEKRVQQLSEQVLQLRNEAAALRSSLSQAGGDKASREDLKHALEKIQEVDRKRAEDRELILREIKELSRLPAPAPSHAARSAPVEEHPRAVRQGERASRPPAEPAPRPEKPADGEMTGEVYVHTVEPGQTLDEIILAYNKAYGMKVKRADVLRANPRLKDPKKLLASQKLNIPVVK